MYHAWCVDFYNFWELLRTTYLHVQYYMILSPSNFLSKNVHIVICIPPPVTPSHFLCISPLFIINRTRVISFRRIRISLVRVRAALLVARRSDNAISPAKERAGIALRGERGDVPYTRLGRSAEAHRNPGSGTLEAPGVPRIRATASRS